MQTALTISLAKRIRFVEYTHAHTHTTDIFMALDIAPDFIAAPRNDKLPAFSIQPRLNYRASVVLSDKSKSHLQFAAHTLGK